MIADHPELAFLPIELREVIEAIYYRDLTFREAATELGITRQKLQTRHDLALELLRNNPQILVADGEGI